MKNVKTIMMAVLGASTIAMAGGDFEPVEPAVNVVEPVAETKNPLAGLYVGAGYGYGSAEATTVLGTTDDNFDTFLLQAGYKVADYIAVEARYWVDMDGDADTWGIYAKPFYPVTDELKVYGLLGYADIDTGESTDGFSWGAGAAYKIMDNVCVFADYVSMYDDEVVAGLDYKADTVNVGVSYKF